MPDNLDPWFWNDYVRIGPFTGTQERNVEADKRYEQLQKEKAAKEGRIPPRAVPRGGGILDFLRGPQGAPQTMNQGGQELRQFGLPGSPEYEGVKRFVDRQSGTTPQPVNQTATPSIRERAAATQYTRDGFPQPDNGIASLQESANVAMDAAVNPPPPVTESIPAEPENPFAQYSALYNQLGIGNRPTGNPYQDVADEYAAKEMNRTKLLARLAFAAGLTSAGGPGFEKIGQGFASAAQVYDQGHERYLKALQTSADRFQAGQEQEYADRVAKAGVIADLYSAGEKQKLDQAKLGSEAQKSRAAMLKDYFDLTIGKPSDYPNPEEDARRQKEMERYRLSLQKAGYDDVVDFDVSD